MNMKKTLMGVMGMAGLVMLSTGPASAYTIQADELQSGGAPWNAMPFYCMPSPGVKACAQFEYSGPLNFDNTATQNNTPAGDLNSDFFIGADISGYTGSGSIEYSPCGCTVANYDNVGDFLASSGSIAGFSYLTLYSVNLGTLAAGTVLTITHDDGIALTDDYVAFGSVTSGPTQAITETATVGTTGDIKLFYTRQNGTPSILQVAVPEPASLAVFGAALIAMAGAAGWMRRERKSA
jgi:hypothetical protein